MTSPAKIEANRRNALMSTGPRTPEGKAASRFNAVSHGLTASAPLLPHEEREDYEELAGAFREELAPIGALEELLVARIAARMFRLARVTRIETGVLVWELHGDAAELDSDSGDEGRSLRRLLAGLGDGNDHTDMRQQQARDADEARSGDLARLGRAFIRDAAGANALSKLSRYEARLDRALLRDLAELHRLKELRASTGN